MSKTNRSRAGFSLVELAIVLIIIALIVGGVLKGQELIESARVNSVQTDLNDIRVAISTFQNKYDELPGDMRDPTILPQTTPALATLPPDPARGNGRIEGARVGTTASEATMSWHHLRVAGLIGGITEVAAGTLGPNEGKQARVNGQYSIRTETFNGTSGNWVRLGINNGTDNTDPVLTPNQLRRIDARADDQRPNAGSIQGTGTGTTCVAGSGPTAQYQTTGGDTVACSALFRL